MRKRYRVLFFAALVAAFAVPVGFAWSIDSAQFRSAHARQRTAVAVAPASATLTSSVVLAPPVSESTPEGVLEMPVVPDAAKLLLVGTVLFGLAAFVRKAI